MQHARVYCLTSTQRLPSHHRRSFLSTVVLSPLLVLFLCTPTLKNVQVQEPHRPQPGQLLARSSMASVQSHDHQDGIFVYVNCIDHPEPDRISQESWSSHEGTSALSSDAMTYDYPFMALMYMQNKKAHRNGIKKPQQNKYSSQKGVSGCPSASCNSLFLAWHTCCLATSWVVRSDNITFKHNEYWLDICALGVWALLSSGAGFGEPSCLSRSLQSVSCRWTLSSCATR